MRSGVLGELQGFITSHMTAAARDDLPSRFRFSLQEWLDSLDFLQQCVPRLGRLIEAGASDLLPGEVLERCLALNDDICKVMAGQAVTQARDMSSDQLGHCWVRSCRCSACVQA